MRVGEKKETSKVEKDFPSDEVEKLVSVQGLLEFNAFLKQHMTRRGTESNE